MVLERDGLHAVTRNNVEVNVLHGLACGLTVVLENVETVAGKRFLDMRRDLLDACDDGGKSRVSFGITST